MRRLRSATTISSAASGTMGSRRSQRPTQMDKDSEEYRRLRERNNQAVKKSRNKSRLKALQTQQRVARLRAEHEDLVRRVEQLQSQLQVYKDLFLQQAGASGAQELQQMDLSFLQDDDTMENHQR